MHLWPSQKIRKYYSYAYVSKFEWNLKQLRQSKAATLVCASDDRCVIREALISSSSSSPLPSSSELRKDAIDPFSKIIELFFLSCCCCCFFFCGVSGSPSFSVLFKPFLRRINGIHFNGKVNGIVVDLPAVRGGIGLLLSGIDVTASSVVLPIRSRPMVGFRTTSVTASESSDLMKAVEDLHEKIDVNGFLSEKMFPAIGNKDSCGAEAGKSGLRAEQSKRERRGDVKSASEDVNEDPKKALMSESTAGK